MSHWESSLRIVSIFTLVFCAMSGSTTTATAAAPANGGVLFHDIAAGGGAGLVYQRTGSASSAIWDQVTAAGIMRPSDIVNTPTKWRGSPGVALLDYDDDGDLDIYVTNGPGTNNSLFSSQLRETGSLSYIDVAEAAGVGAPDQDSSGVCFGDIDNDGDDDLFVLSNFGTNRLFEANGDGTFTDISGVSGLGNDDLTSASCSFGDVNGDGLLDVAIANATEDMSNLLGIAPPEPFLYNQYNQLFLGGPGNVFVDVSETSGVLDLRGFPPGFEGAPAITWAIAMVDFDLDGDIDIVHADDQGGIPRANLGGLDRGFIHLLENDGSGHFTDVTVERNLQKVGEWMGLSFGDLNQDGYLDIFGTNVGDWAASPFTQLDPVYGVLGVYNLGDSASRWFLGSADGTFRDPGVGDLVATPFGWGTSMADYDNDADTDIIYHGGLGFGPVVHSDNLGVMLLNDGAANFTYDAEALSESVDHRRRTVHGVAVGDLDDDGFTDVVSVSNFDKQASIPITLYTTQWGSPFDGLVGYQATFGPTETPFEWAYSGYEDNVDGTLSVEISSGDNGNRWAKVELLGTIGLTAGGAVNRDGIGATVSFRTSHGRSTLRPVTGGSSYASQDSLELVFGLGSAHRGRVDVLWPGGVRNRLYGVKKGERITFPEIPCSIDGDWSGFVPYLVCVGGSLHDLRSAGYISQSQKARFFASAIVAFLVEH